MIYACTTLCKWADVFNFTHRTHIKTDLSDSEVCMSKAVGVRSDTCERDKWQLWFKMADFLFGLGHGSRRLFGWSCHDTYMQQISWLSVKAWLYRFLGGAVARLGHGHQILDWIRTNRSQFGAAQLISVKVRAKSTAMACPLTSPQPYLTAKTLCALKKWDQLVIRLLTGEHPD